MKYEKYAFGWNIYKLEGIVSVYYVGVKDGYAPVEGSTIGEVLEKAASEIEL